MASAIPGSSISTDIFGTTVTLPRTFEPSRVLTDKSPTNLISPGSPFSKLWFATYAKPQSKILDKGAIVVCIDGACTNNGTAAARAGLGVYFGPASPLNLSEPVNGPQTNQRAEIRAAVRALQVAREALKDDFKTNRIVLLSDSTYVVRGITEWVYKWQENGWMDVNGRPLVNAFDFQELDALIAALEEDGINVEFWGVGREDNVQADELAKNACLV